MKVLTKKKTDNLIVDSVYISYHNEGYSAYLDQIERRSLIYDWLGSKYELIQDFFPPTNCFKVKNFETR